GFKLCKYFPFGLCKLAKPLIGDPGPQVFKFFQMFCECGIRLNSRGSVLSIGVQAARWMADLAKNVVHELTELRMSSTSLGDYNRLEPVRISATIKGWRFTVIQLASICLAA